MIRENSGNSKVETAFDNFAETVDKDGTLKTLCKRCGGKRYYVQQYMDGSTMEIVKTDIVKCEACEEGFKYGKPEFKTNSRGSSTRSRVPDNKGRR